MKGALLRRLHTTGFHLCDILGDAGGDREQHGEDASLGTGASPAATRSRGAVLQHMEDVGQLACDLTVVGFARLFFVFFKTHRMVGLKG